MILIEMKQAKKSTHIGSDLLIWLETLGKISTRRARTSPPSPPPTPSRSKRRAFFTHGDNINENINF